MSEIEKIIEIGTYRAIDLTIADAERKQLLPIGTEFPTRLWELFAERDLLALTLPKALHGKGLSYLHGMQAGRHLVKKLHSPGLAMAWVMHQFAVPMLNGIEDTTVRQESIRALVKGKGLLAIAISEPGVGAHPKKLTTHAVEEDDCFVINGEKAHITNGPIADYYIVLAITAENNGHKEFSAFCIPKETEGLERLEKENFAALSPLAHCGLKFVNCKVPKGNRIGKAGEAFELIGKSVRTYEDTLMMGPITGALELQLELTLKHIDSKTLAPETAQQLGELVAIKDTLLTLALKAARSLQISATEPQLVSCIISFRLLSLRFQELIKLAFPDTPEDSQLTSITADVALLLSIALSANRLKQQTHGNLYFQEISA